MDCTSSPLNNQQSEKIGANSHENLINLVMEQQHRDKLDIRACKTENVQDNVQNKFKINAKDDGTLLNGALVVVDYSSVQFEGNANGSNQNVTNNKKLTGLEDENRILLKSVENFRNVNDDVSSDELISKQTSGKQLINGVDQLGDHKNSQSINDKTKSNVYNLIDTANVISDELIDTVSTDPKDQLSINKQANLINQLNELVYCNNSFNYNSAANSTTHLNQTTIDKFDSDLNRCKRRHNSSNYSDNFKFNHKSSYNTFNDKYLESSVSFSSSLPANNQFPIWNQILNKFNSQKGYEKIGFNDNLDQVKELNEKNQSLNQQNNYLDNNSKFNYQNLDNSSNSLDSPIINFFQTVISSQRNMTATNAIDLSSDQGKFKPPSRSNSGYLSSTGIQLKQNLGLLNGVCIIVGVIVGSGIFISPKGVLETSHSVGLSLSIWICCGFLSLIGALCYAELGTAIPKSGGDYAYIKEAFGDLPAFLFLWVATLIIMPTGNAIAALTFANYVLVPYYRYVGCGDPPEQAAQLIAIILVCFLTFINCYNVRWSAFLMDAFTFAKVFALTIIVGVGFWQILRGSTHNFENMFQGSSTSPQHIALSFYSGLFSYAGWNFLNFVTEELKDPFKTLPRAIYISLPLVTIIYVLANVAYFTVLSPIEIVESNAVAISFGDRVLGVFSWTMPVFVVLSTFGGLNGSIFTSSRLFFVGARNGHLPRVLGQINVHYYTPVPSLLFMCLTTLVYLSTANVYLLINYTAFNESLFITLSVAGLLWLRYKQPDLERPIKVNIILPIFFFVVCSFLVLLPVVEKPVETGISALITLTGIPVYLVTIAWKNKPALYNKINDSITRFLQVLLITIEEKRS